MHYSSQILVAIAVGLGLLASPLSAQEKKGEKTHTNSLGMELARIGSGVFRMGQSEGGEWDEKPAHEVAISKPFYMGVTEVTNAQYEEFDPAHRKLRGKLGLSKDDNEAVVFVSWGEAMRFCQWLSEKEGTAYRLPTEAEWEYACRANTTSLFNTGDELPELYHKNQKETWVAEPVSLRVKTTPANAWGLHDMHGNVEEWCMDWYGPYESDAQTDPAGRVSGDFRVSRGGSHGTEVQFLRSANRMAALPEDKTCVIGFRVVMADMPETKSLPMPEPQLWAKNVSQKRYDWPQLPDPQTPYFEGPVRYVHIPEGSNGPLYSKHNHCPALTECPNGDLLAIWYTTNREAGRELAVTAARLRQGATEWEPATPFWDVPDRNDHASALMWDGKDTIYHYNGVCSDATWGKLALFLRTSTDNGATWSGPRWMNTEHGLRNMPIARAIMTSKGHHILPCDAFTGGHGGTAVHISKDGGKTWVEPGRGTPVPKFEAGETGGWIAGIHAGVVELNDGRLMALGRGNNINDKMPMSVSSDGGLTWTYHETDLPRVDGGQRLTLRRLHEGPLLLVAFSDPSGIKNPAGMVFKDKDGGEFTGYGMYAALSFDEGKTWPARKLVTPGGAAKEYDGGAWTSVFTLDATHAEPKGYLTSTQTPDGIIHLISSGLHYKFNLAWLKE